MHLKLTSVVILWWLGVFHPFHISVMDAEFNPEAKSIQISHRLFLDDLEEGLMDFYGLESVDTAEPENAAQLDSLIAKYLQSKVFFTVNGEDKSFKYYGSELEGDARWCYYEIENVESLTSFELTNVALMDVFDDQQNIIHLKVNGKIQSYKLDKGTKAKTFTF